MLEIGIKNRKSTEVTLQNTAVSVGSGTLEVFATPAMCALMEATAAESVETLVDEGCTTVGTRLNITHVSATPVGMSVHCESELTAIEGRKLMFKVTAFDEKGIIGEGEHDRFIINAEKFMTKTNEKNN